MRSQARPISDWSQDSARLTTDDGTSYVELAPLGAVNVLAPGGMKVIGTLEVTELLIADDGMEVSGTVVAEGGTFALDGALAATGEVTGNGIPLSTHIHPGVEPGGGDTGADP